MGIFSIIFALLTVVVLLLKYCATYWQRRGVETVPPTIFFGNAGSIIRQKEPLGINVSNFYSKLKKRGGKFGGYYFLFRPMFIPFDLDLIKRMSITDFGHFTDHIGHVDDNDPLSTHLFSLKGERWKKLRSKITPTFTPAKIKMMFDTLLEIANNLTLLMEEIAENKEVIDIKRISERFTTDTTISCGFGIESSALKNVASEFQVYQKRYLDPNLYRSLLVLLQLILPEFYTALNIKTFDKDVTDFFVNMVKKAIDHREKENVIRKDFMHLLIQTRNNVNIEDDEVGVLKSNDNSQKGASLSVEEMAAQCFVFFFGGYETSSITITFTLLELALNPDIQDKVRDEINTVINKHNGKISYDAVMEIEYLHKCVSETLRKHPPVQVNTRVCTKDYTVPGTNFVINKGMNILIPIYGIHHDPDYFPDPDKYDPERFSKENCKNRHAFAYMPFGGGPRMCIGFMFGQLQTKLALTLLLKKFKFFVHPDTVVPIQFNPKTVMPNAMPPIKLIAQKVNTD